MDKFIINGPSVLHGDVTISGAKNVALKTIVASLLTDDPVILHNIPHIRDVTLMLEIIESLGSSVTFEGNTVRIANEKTRATTVPLEVGARLLIFHGFGAHARAVRSGKNPQSWRV